LDKTAITMSEDSPVNETERHGTEKESTDSPVHHTPTTDKEGVPFAAAHTDVENGDTGILVHAAPLARKLKGRHMQMIAIGKHFPQRGSTSAE
jgi:amino acid permease